VIPTIPQVGRAALGFVALGLAGALAQGPAPALHAAPGGLAVHLGAYALTAPSLLVVHPFLGLDARPDALVAILARGFVRAGDLALGLTPLLAFFALTTTIGPALFPILLGCAGAAALVGVAGELVATEAPAGLRRMQALTAAWCALTVLGAARIGWEVLA
jgi:exosortase/archaeosortase